MTYVKQLRDAAANCSNVEYRAVLKQAADKLEVAVLVLYEEATEDHMIALNGLWAHCAALLRYLPPEGTPDPTSGDTTASEFQQERGKGHEIS